MQLPIMENKVYFPHLDGLRTVALLGVLFFHFEVAPFSGGFVGVDLFLTISGFLITHNILHDVNFSLRKFYIRRFHRLYPASVTTALFTLVLSFFIFPPDVSSSTSMAALSSMFFSSNFFFWLKDNYFDSSAKLKPLLHTWSLSLEEQFYLIWAPIIVYSSPKHTTYLSILALASFTVAIWMSHQHPSFVFFHLPSRLFQFSTGALIAIYKPYRLLSEKNTLLSDSIVLTALIGIFSCYVSIPNFTPPIQMMFVSFLGAVLVAVPHGYVSGRVLSNDWIREIGKLSYSAYLVHWPIYVSTLYVRNGLHQPPISPLILVVTTFVFASVLKVFVEEPVRKGRNRKMFWFTCFLTIVIASAGVFSRGFRFRLSSTTLRRLSNPKQLEWELGRSYCHDNASERSLWRHADEGGCLVGNVEGEESRYVIMGDSFAIQMAPGLDMVGRQRGEYYRMLFQTGCAFLPRNMPKKDLSRIKDGKNPCGQEYRRRWEAVEKLKPNRTIVISNHWWWSEEKTKDGEQRQRMLLTNMVSEFRKLGHDVMFITESPGLDDSEDWLFACIDMMLLPIGELFRAIRRKSVDGRAGCVDSGMAKPLNGRLWQADGYRTICTDLGVHLIDLHGELCRREGGRSNTTSSKNMNKCRLPAVDVGENGEPVVDVGYRRDKFHLSIAGSRSLALFYESNLIEYERSRNLSRPSNMA